MNRLLPTQGADVLSSPGNTILVCDDTPENVRMLSKFLASSGYEVLIAQNGIEAIQLCQLQLPDLIIMDVAMPGMDGFEATRQIRQLYPDSWIPIIFLSAHADQHSQMQGLSAGGDDYLTKPVNLPILAEKIKALLRIAESRARVALYASQLESRIAESEEEQAFAKHLMQHLMQHHLEPSDGVWQLIEPAQNFSGDAILSTRGPGGEYYIMAMDATGHGLAAAISVLPVIEAFFRLAEKGFSINSIVSELNQKTRKLLPVDRFIAATIAVVDPQQRSLNIWNGGLPEACFISADGRVLKRWKSCHPPLGIKTDEAFKPEAEWYVWNENGQLFIHTDGLEEVEDTTGMPLGQDRILAVATATVPAQRLDAVSQLVRNHIGPGQAHDDITMVFVDCPMETRTTRPTQVITRPQSAEYASNWSFTLRLDATQLRNLDIVPLVMNWLEQLKLDEQYRGIAFMILAELINNALDHGLLQLDSTLKQEPDGFERYLTDRSRRLASLSTGFIELAIEQIQPKGVPQLKITVRDSGEGFTYRDYLPGLSDLNSAPSGRGLALVKTMAGNLSFNSTGNEVTALLPLSQKAS